MKVWNWGMINSQLLAGSMGIRETLRREPV